MPFLACPPTNEFFEFDNATEEEIESYALSFVQVTWNLTAYATETALTDFVKNSEKSDQIFMGIVFNEDSWSGDDVPNTLDYKIRPLAVPRSETSSQGFASALGWLTDLLYPQQRRQPGPRSGQDVTGGSPYYAAEGFIYFQYLINDAFSKEKNAESGIGPVEMKRFPYPEYTLDSLMIVLQNELAFNVLITTLYLSSGTAKTLVIEKETRLKEYMLMMGLNRNTLWLATWLFAFFKFLITAFIYTITLFIPFTSNGAVFLVSNWFCFFIFLLSYGVSLISLGFFMGALFSTSTSAAVATGGVQFSNFFTPISTTNPTNFGTQMVMLLIDAILYFLLGIYVDTIRPGQWGIPKPWNFFCMPSYWSPPKKNQVDASNEMVTENLLEQKLPSGVSKEAVDNLSIDAYQNEITVLLGPNGAGKSTTINMMSGMLVADSGTCEVGGYNITTNPWAARASLGLCPQHDILIAELTVQEHLVFFAEIKGFTNKQAETEARTLADDIQLGKKRNIASAKLSGGMKRKLSIGIALCGGSKHLILDEHLALELTCEREESSGRFWKNIDERIRCSYLRTTWTKRNNWQIELSSWLAEASNALAPFCS
ncbi:unnamed protein product [Oikopleura dioica]|uniref:ABC transporter domain-containing protein n=1 Tax=Oikopleura dioica TaxID=34765 RepID=E4XHW8_OIKDI|nr:unnamed protein product [Oikopleura dioica]